MPKDEQQGFWKKKPSPHDVQRAMVQFNDLLFGLTISVEHAALMNQKDGSIPKEQMYRIDYYAIELRKRFEGACEGRWPA